MSNDNLNRDSSQDLYSSHLAGVVERETHTPATAEGVSLADDLVSGSDSDFGDSPLLYLNSNNSTETFRNSPLNNCQVLTPYHQKQAYSLANNVSQFCKLHGVEKVGFLTLTFPDNVTCHKEAQRRFNSLATHYLRSAFPAYMLVKERQQRGAWHYHLLVACNADIRTGLDFQKVFPKVGRGDYSSASPYLRSLWRDLRSAMSRYGFGRSELAPVKSTEDGIAHYVGKYIQHNAMGKHLSGYDDKGVRIVSYSTRWARTTMSFAWNTPGAKEWRRKVKRFATEYVGVKHYEELSLKLGRRWAYFFSDVIHDIDFIVEAIRVGRSDYGGNYLISDGQIVDPLTGVVLVESKA